ncbi:MAG: hypothetical protein R2755_07370 [Acidimicrobiales bacterium]
MAATAEAAHRPAGHRVVEALGDGGAQLREAGVGLLLGHLAVGDGGGHPLLDTADDGVDHGLAVDPGGIGDGAERGAVLQLGPQLVGGQAERFGGGVEAGAEHASAHAAAELAHGAVAAAGRAGGLQRVGDGVGLGLGDRAVRHQGGEGVGDPGAVLGAVTGGRVARGGGAGRGGRGPVLGAGDDRVADEDAGRAADEQGAAQAGDGECSAHVGSCSLRMAPAPVTGGGGGAPCRAPADRSDVRATAGRR